MFNRRRHVAPPPPQLAAPTAENYRRFVRGERMLTELIPGEAY